MDYTNFGNQKIIFRILRLNKPKFQKHTRCSYTGLMAIILIKPISNIICSPDTMINIYETVAIIGKRANQIAVEMKNDLSKKLQEFASYNDNLEEVFENREQIEISRYYEKLPKPTLIATQEYIEGKVYYRNPAKEKEKLQ